MNWLDNRICEEASYIVEHRATVRDAARALCVGKSTVHKNKAERHLRGGQATHDKYATLRQRAGDVSADR